MCKKLEKIDGGQSSQCIEVPSDLHIIHILFNKDFNDLDFWKIIVFTRNNDYHHLKMDLDLGIVLEEKTEFQQIEILDIWGPSGEEIWSNTVYLFHIVFSFSDY